MKTKTLFLCAALLAANSTFGGIGRPAPDFTAADFDGNKHHLGDYKGKIVVLEAYDPDCPYGRNHYQTGAMQELQREATAKGVVWLLVYSVAPKHADHHSAEAAKKEWANQKIAATAWLDDSSGAIAFSNGISVSPEIRIIDQKGVMAYAGAVDDYSKTEGDSRTAHNFVREALNNLLAGKEVREDKTQIQHGCPIKNPAVTGTQQGSGKK
jgi:peroxiredoxin